MHAVYSQTLDMAIPFPHLLYSEKRPIPVPLATPAMSPPLAVVETRDASTQDDLKRIAAHRAVELVESGMVLGLGTGSTAAHALDCIGELIRRGTLRDVVGIPTSKKTEAHATAVGIPLSMVVARSGTDEEVAGGGREEGVVREAVGEGGAEAGRGLGGEGDGAAAEADDAAGGVDDGASGDVKGAAKWEGGEGSRPAGAGIEASGLAGEESGGVGVAEAAGGVEAGAGGMARMGDETAGRVVAVEGGEGGGEAGEEGRTGGVASRAAGAAARGAAGPDKVAAGVGDEANALRGSADAEVDEVLTGAGEGGGDDGDKRGGGGGGEGGEAEGVEGESLAPRGGGVPSE